MEKKNSGIYVWFYQRFLLGLLLVLAVVGGISTTIYLISERKIKEVAFEKSDQEIEYYIGKIDEILMEAEDVADQMTSTLILNGTSASNFSLRNYASITFVKSFSYFQQSILQAFPYVYDIRIYELKNGVMITPNNVALLTEEEKTRLYELGKDRSREWLDGGEDEDLEGRIENSRLVIPVSGYTQDLQYLVIVEMDNQEIFRRISGMMVDESIIGILDSGEKVIFNQELLEEKGILEGLKNGENRRQTVKGNDGNYLVTEAKSEINGWQYIVAIQENELTSGIREVQTLIIGVGLIFSILIIVVLFCLARKLFIPVKSIKSLVNQIDGTQHSEIKNELVLLDYQIRDVVQMLEMERHRNTVMKDSLEQREQELKQYSLYKRLFGGDLDQPQEKTEKDEGQEQDAGAAYVCAVVEVETGAKEARYRVGRTSEVWEKILQGAEHILEAIFSKQGIEYEKLRIMKPDEAKIYILITLNQPVEERVFAHQLKAELQFYQNLLLGYFGCACTIGIGNIADSVSQISKSRLTAEEYLKYKFVLGTHQCICRYDVESDTELMSYMDYYYIKGDLKEKLKTCTPGELRAIIRQYFDAVMEKQAIADYEYYCKDVLNIIYEALLERDVVNMENFRLLTKYFTEFKYYFTDMEQFTETISRQLADAFNTPGVASCSKTVQNAVELIKANYQTDLSLQALADQLQVSAPYLSKLFKEELGISFKEYLTSLKMQKAKELMENSDLSLQEIAFCVGYNDYKHFSAMFKKKFGVTAGAYRKTFGK